AIGVMAARDKNVRRIAVLDFDVHHGNGTQHSFENDGEIFYASTHQYPFYPGTGNAGERGAHDNVMNVPLAAGSGDRAFLGAWEKKIGPALAVFRPELLVVSAGFDAHRNDPIGGLEVTTEGYGALAGLIKGWATEYSQGRTVWVLEGGYDLRAIGDSMVACIDILADRLAQVQQEQARQQQRLSALQGQQGELRQTLAVLQAQLVQSNADLAPIAARARAIEAQLAEAQLQFSHDQLAYLQHLRAFQADIRKLYALGGIRWLEFVFSARSFDDLMNRTVYLQQISVSELQLARR